VVVVIPHSPGLDPEVSVHNLTVGQAKVDLRVLRSADGTHELDVQDARGAPLEVVLEP